VWQARAAERPLLQHISSIIQPFCKKRNTTMTNNWKDKALAATQGSQLGAIVARVLDREIPAPHFNGKAIVTSDGFLLAHFTARNGDRHADAFVGTLIDLQRNVGLLADHLKLTAEERGEFADALAGWIGIDYNGRRSTDAADRLRKAVLPATERTTP
jgi:hypothetical protein